MSSLPVLFLIIEGLAGLVLAGASVRHLDASTGRTWAPIPLVWVGLGVGGLSIALAALRGDMPSDWRIAFAMACMAIFAVIDRRRGRV